MILLRDYFTSIGNLFYFWLLYNRIDTYIIFRYLVIRRLLYESEIDRVATNLVR